MNKTIKKLIVCILVFLTIFNFTISGHIYAAIEDDNALRSTVGSAVDAIIGLLGGLVGLLTWPGRLLGVIAGILIQSLMSGVAIVMAEGAYTGWLLTPADIFFNKVGIIDINFLNLDNSLGTTVQTIRETVAGWYYICRLLAIGILLLILLYIGIRMAISTIASEKAVYKKMLVDWITSLALVFLLHYIIMFTINFNEAVVKALETIAKGVKMEDFTGQLIGASLGIGISSWGALVCYFMMMLQTLAFLISYIKRMLTVGFLIIISPLISITYSVDKIGDGKAQALDSWLKEFVYNILIQPFHCILYLVFVGTAIQIVNKDASLAAMIFSILCMKFIWDGEKIVRKIFGFEKAGSLASAAASAAIATAAVGNIGKTAKGAATGVRKGINFFKENGALAAMKNDAGKGLKKLGLDKESRKESFINKETKKGIKDGLSEEEASKRATKKAESKYEKTSSKEMKSRRERKEEKRSREKAAYDEDKQIRETGKNKNGDTVTKEERKAASDRAEKYEKSEKARESRKKTISGFKSGASKIGEGIKNSETFKHFKDPKTLKALKQGAVKFTTGLAFGAMTYGAESTGVLSALAVGKGAAQFSDEMMKTSKGTLKGSLEGQLAAQYSMNGEKMPDNIAEFLKEIKSMGEAGGFDPSIMQEELKECVEKIISAARDLGMKLDKVDANGIMTGINAGLSKSGSEEFDLERILTQKLKNVEGFNEGNVEKLISKSEVDGYADRVSQAKIYGEIQTQEAVGFKPTETSLGITKQTIITKEIELLEKRVRVDGDVEASRKLDELKRKIEGIPSPTLPTTPSPAPTPPSTKPTPKDDSL